MIRNANRNISVSKAHSYTVEKVKYAMDFINSPSRNKTLEDWVNAYNHIKGTNETIQGCQACKAAKFTAAVRNYAQYGYLTLINEGYSPEEFKEQPVKTADVAVLQSDDDEVLENALETLKKVQEVTQEVENVTEVEQPVVEEAEQEVAEVEGAILAERQQPVEKKKVGRPKKVKK